MPVIRVAGHKLPIAAILFDKDGTLLDFMKLWGIWAEMVTRQMKMRVQELNGTLLGGDEGLLGTCLDENGKVTGYDRTGPLAMGSEEETLGLLAWQLYQAGDPWNEAIVKVREISATAMRAAKRDGQAQPMADLIPLLEKARELGIRLGVVTTDGSGNAREHLRAMSIEGYFGSIIGHDQVRRGKPAPDMVRLACRELGVLPEQCVVIGDSNADMQMGKSAKSALTIGYSQTADEGAYLTDADVRITSYTQISLEPDT
ncbi:HAD family hydrolase [Paenibacillus tuaregi]|uniref:HAD family hydrolase n=1 Tax=Paenibacillus tuaregi TaxID=1816681 RepID=UPI000837AE44|nr:HAD family phosphatase [Paenibacillus tuaregi]